LQLATCDGGAIKIDAAWSMNDPRRKKSIQSGLGTTQKPSAAVCLDLTALLPGVSSVTFDSQPFSDPRVTEPIMRSPVILLRISR
jgi:hypothetical protein